MTKKNDDQHDIERMYADIALGAEYVMSEAYNVITSSLPPATKIKLLNKLQTRINKPRSRMQLEKQHNGTIDQS